MSFDISHTRFDSIRCEFSIHIHCHRYEKEIQIFEWYNLTGYTIQTRPDTLVLSIYYLLSADWSNNDDNNNEAVHIWRKCNHFNEMKRIQSEFSCEYIASIQSIYSRIVFGKLVRMICKLFG